MAIFNLKNEPIEGILEYSSILEEQDDEATLRYVREKIDETIGRLNVDRAKIKVAGFALPGLIDREGTSYTYLTYEQPGIKGILEEMLQIPVFIDNDSNVMAMAEHTFGVAKDVNNVLCVSVNECIGLGMILNSKLYRGGIGMAGEFGAYSYLRTGASMSLREDRLFGNRVFGTGHRECGGQTVTGDYRGRPEG